MRAVVHSLGHRGAVEVGAKANVVRTGQLYYVIDVVDNLFPGNVWQLPFRGGSLFHLVHFLPKTFLVVATHFFELIEHGHDTAGNLLRRLAIALINEALLVIDLNDAALSRQGLDHVVGHVARMIADRAARRMRRNQRRLAHFQRVVKRLVADMRNIHHHSLAVHFANDFLAILGQAIVRRLVGGGVRPFIVVKMRKRHVPHAEIAEDAHHADVVPNHVPAFDANQRGYFSFGLRLANVGSSAREHHVLGILADIFVNRVNLVERFLNCRRTHRATVNPNRKENRIHSAFLHARNVDVTVGIAFGEIEVFRKETLCRVVVRIQHDRGEMKFARPLGDVVAKRNGRWNTK